jgi:hypothetical protein
MKMPRKEDIKKTTFLLRMVDSFINYFNENIIDEFNEIKT